MKKLILIFITFLAFNVKATDWIDCGEDAKGNITNCQYKIENKTLIIKAKEGNNGNIGYWYSSTSGHIQPWKDDNVQNILIDNSINNLGSYAFNGMTIQSPIQIPSSVEVISYAAFWNTQTPEIIIPNSVKKIESAALNYVKTLNIPDSVEEIANSAFRNASKINEIFIPDSVTSIGDGALSLWKGLKIFVISDKTELGKIFDDSSDIHRLVDLQNLNIYCTGNVAQCDTNLANAGYDNLHSQIATIKKINGVTYVHDKNGKLITTSGKRTERRIYTIDEANAVAKPTGNTVRIKYR